MNDQEQKRIEYLAYRRIAQAMKKAGVRVSDTANVWPTEGGAFVEATVWIPETAIMVQER